MEQFRLRSGTDKVPPIRVSTQYYRLLCQIKAETGIPMGTIVEQCVAFALSHGDTWEKDILDQYIKPRFPAGCPLLEQEAEEGGATCPEQM